MSDRIKKIIRISFKILLMFVIAFAVMFFVLSNIGGKNAQLREGAEQFLSKATGGRAVIGNLVYLGFVPNIRVEMEDVIFQEEGNPTNVLMRIDKLAFSIPFMHYILNKKTAEQISVSEWTADAGFLTPKSFAIDLIEIEEGDVPSIHVDGEYGTEDFTAKVTLIPVPLKDNRLVYKLPKVTPISFKTDSFDFEAKAQGTKKGTKFTDMSIIAGDVSIMGDAEMTFDEDFITIDGEFKKGETGFALDLTFESEIEAGEAGGEEEQDTQDNEGEEQQGEEDPPVKSVTGTITSDGATPQELQDIDDALNALAVYFFGADPENDAELDVKLKVESLTCGEGQQPLEMQLQPDREKGSKRLWRPILESDTGLTQASPCANYFGKL